jgi:ribonucleoside-diphosphate reductase alpha chain
MGFQDALVDLRIPYASAEAVAFARELTSFVHDESWAASKRLAAERGPFPAWEESISLVAGCSAGSEPIYGVSYTKQVLGGLEIRNDRFVELANERRFYSEELLADLHGRTTIPDVEAIPDEVEPLFQTAHDVPVEQHLNVQAAFQEHVDNAVSKTVNVPRSTSVDEVRELLVTARELDLKGVTVFRSGAKREQVLGESPRKEECVGECDYVGQGVGIAVALLPVEELYFERQGVVAIEKRLRPGADASLVARGRVRVRRLEDPREHPSLAFGDR